MRRATACLALLLLVHVPRDARAGLDLTRNVGDVANVTGIAPSLVSNRSEFEGVVISGSGFVPGLLVHFEHPPGTLIISVGAEEIGPGGTTATMSITPAGAPLGVYDIVAMNPGGPEMRLTGAFTIAVPPHITSVTPSAAPDTGVVTIEATGSSFESAATMTLSRLGEASIPGTVVSIDPSGMVFGADFDLRGRAAGPWNVIVTNPTGLTDRRTNGFTIQTLLDAPPPSAGRELTLASVAPNPTSGPATVTFTLASETRVRLSVVDVLGRETAVLVNGVRPAGRHEARWDGRGRQGTAQTGMYFVRMEAGGRTFMKRFVMTR
jgi:hypothetical protein